MLNKRKIINDPVFGFITIPSDFIYELLQHPYVERLTRIKQLGLTCLVYPGAQHTRFQHSLGALFLMTEAIKTLRSKGHDITDEEADAVYAAILLHDLGHGPFSHTLEQFFFSAYNHEKITLHLIEQMNQEFDGKLNLTIEILKDTYHKHFLHSLVSGQLDMDRLDYLRRDSFFSGVVEGNIGSARIIKMLNIQDDNLVVDAKGIYSIENFLMARRLMYWQVYLHKTAVAAEEMLVKTLERARYLKMNGIEDIFSTPSLLPFLEQARTTIDDDSITHFMRLDDNDIWTSIKEWQYCNDKVLSILCQGIVKRKVFKNQAVIGPISEQEMAQKHAEIATYLGISTEDAAYLTSLRKASNHIYSKEDTAINILFSDGSTKNILEASDMFNIDVFYKKVTKYYFCYLRMH